MDGATAQDVQDMAERHARFGVARQEMIGAYRRWIASGATYHQLQIEIEGTTNAMSSLAKLEGRHAG